MVKYIENYALYQSIGSGVYGKVYRAINNTDKKQYAVKVIPIAKFRQNKKLQQCTVNQINILTNIEVNQHIIRYFDMLKTTNNFYFIYEYCNGGTLEGLLSRQGKLSEQSALLIFKQLLQAFQVLNKYNIMHRDLKPDNIFFHNGIIKLGDFGFCKNLNSADQMAKTMLGSPIYMAPQVLKGQIYSNKADIWSLGVVLYQMLFGHCPFQSNSIAKLIQVLNTKQLEFPQKIAQFLKDLIQRMLTKDPTKRIGWMQMFQIKISNQGTLENQKIKAISSLSDAKFSDEISGSLTSTKYTPPNMTSSVKQVSQQPIQSSYNNLAQNNPNTTVTQNQISNNNNQSPQSQYPGSQLNQNEANFKKNRNTSQSNPQVPSLNSINQSQQQTSHSQAQTNFSPNHINPNAVQNNYLQSSTNNNNLSMNQSPTSSMQVTSNTSNTSNTNANVNPLSISSSGSKIGQQHKTILEGVKLSMQIIDSRIPNYSGYAHLILTKNISNLQSLVQRPFRKQILQILDKQLKDMKNQRDFVTSKMFSYQLKGLDDWKKYMRGKFFEDEKTIALWYRMVNFLNSTGSFSLNSNLNISQMAQSVKGILY